MKEPIKAGRWYAAPNAGTGYTRHMVVSVGPHTAQLACRYTVDAYSLTGQKGLPSCPECKRMAYEPWRPKCD